MSKYGHCKEYQWECTECNQMQLWLEQCHKCNSSAPEKCHNCKNDIPNWEDTNE